MLCPWTPPLLTAFLVSHPPGSPHTPHLFDSPRTAHSCREDHPPIHREHGVYKDTSPCNLKPNDSLVVLSILFPSNHPRRQEPADVQAHTASRILTPWLMPP